MRAPAPQERLGQRAVIGRVPAHALDRAGDAQFAQLVCQIGGERLPHRVAVGVEQVQLGAHAVFHAHTVLPQSPARFVQQGRRRFGVIFHLGGLVIPRKLVADAVRRRAVAVQHMIDHLLPVDADIDGAAHAHVSGKVVADRAAFAIRTRRNGG